MIQQARSPNVFNRHICFASRHLPRRKHHRTACERKRAKQRSQIQSESLVCRAPGLACGRFARLFPLALELLLLLLLEPLLEAAASVMSVSAEEDNDEEFGLNMRAFVAESLRTAHTVAVKQMYIVHRTDLKMRFCLSTGASGLIDQSIS